MNCAGLLGGAGGRSGVHGTNSKMATMQHHHHVPSNVVGGGAAAAVLGVGHHLRGDDGSSGYGSPDSETFETPANQ